jgi:hypothetical protein
VDRVATVSKTVASVPTRTSTVITVITPKEDLDETVITADESRGAVDEESEDYLEKAVITEDNLELMTFEQLLPVITAITEKPKEEEPLLPVITTITEVDDSDLFEEIGDGKYRWKVIQDGNVCVHRNCVTERVRYCGIEEVKRFVQSYQSKIDKKMGDSQINEKWVKYWSDAYDVMKHMQDQANT